MMKKICPVCDLPVNEANYCSRCKRVVRKPIIWEVNYFLNEKGSKSASSGKRVETGKKRTNYLPVILILVFLFFTLGSSVIGYTIATVSVNDNYEAAAGFDDYGYRDLEEEEVIIKGEPCNGYEHFTVDGSMVSDSMKQFIETQDYGYRVDFDEQYSDNYELLEDSDPVSYYETVDSFYLEPINAEEEDFSEDDYYEYLDINYDTATGELHGYETYLENSLASMMYMEQFLTIVEDATGISGEQSSVDAIMNQAASSLEQETGAYILEGIFDVHVYLSDGMIRINISCNNPETVENQEI